MCATCTARRTHSGVAAIQQATALCEAAREHLYRMDAFIDRRRLRLARYEDELRKGFPEDLFQTGGNDGSASATGDDRSGSPPGAMLTWCSSCTTRGQVDELSRALTSLLERTAMTARQVKEFRLAVLEMAGNAIEWGRGDGRGDAGPRHVPGRAPGRHRDRAGSGAGLRSQSGRPNAIGGRCERFLWDRLRRALPAATGLRRTCLPNGPGRPHNDRGNQATLVKRFGLDPELATGDGTAESLPRAETNARPEVTRA